MAEYESCIKTYKTVIIFRTQNATNLKGISESQREFQRLIALQFRFLMKDGTSRWRAASSTGKEHYWTSNTKIKSRNTQTNGVNDGGLGRLATITVKKNLAELKPILEDQITFWNVFGMLKLIWRLNDLEDQMPIWEPCVPRVLLVLKTSICTRWNTKIN